MKKSILLLAIAGIFVFKSNAQIGRCATEDYVKDQMLKDPQYAKNRQALEEFTKQRDAQMNQPGVRKASPPPYVIPVVFHILHDYGPENVSDDVIRETVRQMNEDFNKQNADTSLIIPLFQNIIADCQIEFRLATKDPNGGCTNGIEHIFTPLTYSADDGSKLHPWPNNKYLNIWVAHSLANTGAAAYAYYPGVSGAIDGVMCWVNYVDNSSQTLTHEVGHCLNLKHVWGDSNDPEVVCGDDAVGDTPETMGWSPGNCNLSGSVCNPPIIENVQNYMDYSYCNYMFTEGQRTRMHNALNSATGGRNNLWTPNNLVLTGTDGTPNVCTPNADFITDNEFACAGDSILFTDLSTNAIATGWQWDFPGGSPATSTDRNPSVAYAAPGVYSATLRVSNSAGIDSITKTSVVRVTANALNAIPFVEGFETAPTFPGNDGYVINTDNGSTWSRVTNAAATGSACVKMNNYTNTSGAVDEWVTPSMDFSFVGTPINLSFKVSAAQRNGGSNDMLKIYYSTNCGRSWQSTSYSKSGPTLATAGIITSNFTPNNANQWRQESIIVNSVHHKSNVRFKFQNTSDRGNNIYIDDINITGSNTAIEDIDLIGDFNLYPNPTHGSSTIGFMLTKTSKVRVEVKDIIGQTVSSVLNETIGAGSHEQLLPNLSPGIYLVDLTVNNKHYVKKLVVS